jgi:hypothetical protein
MTEEDLIKIHNDGGTVNEEIGGGDDGSDKEKANEISSSKKDYMRIRNQIENKDHKVDEWIMHKFHNPARTDDLRIPHWAKVIEKDEVYNFAKFNKYIEVFKFTDLEYKDIIVKMPRDAGKTIWSKNDTTVLFELSKGYQLRWIPITDRFNFEKSIEYKKHEEKFAPK